MSDLSRAALDVNWRNLALGHEVFEADGATFARNTAYPSIYDANFMFEVTAATPDEIDRLLLRAQREYVRASRITFRLDPHVAPAFEARLALDGYEHSESLVMLLEGSLRGEPKPCDIRLIEDDAGWEAMRALKRAEWGETAVRVGEDPANMAIPDGLMETNKLKCPPVRYFLAYIDGVAVGFFNAWAGIDGVGQVEDLYVDPVFRHRGIATSLIHHCVADARERGAGPLVIVCDPTDTPKDMYAALGFRPVAVTRQYGLKRG